MTTKATSAGARLYARARHIIPGGTQLLSKRPEMFLPDQWPNYYSRAQGAYVWDLDGARYLDMTHFGVGACVLGFADPDVNAAVQAAVSSGSMSTLNCPEEVELAELMLELHPWAEMARFGRSGGEAVAIAVRIARAASGRDKVAFCGYHGWHDWYLAANLSEDQALDGHLLPGLQPRGVPRGLAGTMLPFHYNNIGEFRGLIERHGRELAAIVMEPARNEGPAAGFLEEIRETASRIGAALIFDEVTSAWRVNTGGIHLVYGIQPDVAVFAKAMGNGFPMAAVIGTRPVMEAAQASFISSTYWTERVGPAAALATIRKHREQHVADHLIAAGARIQDGWSNAAKDAGLAVHVGGIKPLSHFTFDGPRSAEMLTLFIQSMLDRSILASGQVYTSLAHTESHVQRYLDETAAVFREIASAVADGTLAQRLRGPVKHAGFHRLN